MTTLRLKVPTTDKLVSGLITECVKSAIGADVLGFVWVVRPTYDPENGFDVRGTFLVLWSRDTRRGEPGERNWGTHKGAVRGPRSELMAHIFSGNYDCAEADARRDFADRQDGLG
jgi:hypothetical protein